MATIIKQVVGSGIPPLAATNLAGSVANGLTALGTNQATALVLPAAICEITTAASSTGITPQADAGPGDEYLVFNNNTTQSIIFYPPGTDTINNAATSFTLATNKVATFTKVSASHWVSNLTA